MKIRTLLLAGLFSVAASLMPAEDSNARPRPLTAKTASEKPGKLRADKALRPAASQSMAASSKARLQAPPKMALRGADARKPALRSALLKLERPGARASGRNLGNTRMSRLERRQAMRLVSMAAAPAVSGSLARQSGLHTTPDLLDLDSSAALVLDQGTGAPIYEKNVDAVLPIASITKLMTSVVTVESNAPLGEIIELSEADIPPDRYRKSRLTVGTRLTRAELLQLALMASDNRAAFALGRHHPGGLDAFVQAMNIKALQLGMTRSRFVEPTGLSSDNVSTPRDLARLVQAAYEKPLIRQYSTSTDLLVDAGGRLQQFHNTNRLLSSPEWEIGLSKTGFISAAGKCLVMQVRVDRRPTIIVLLDANGSRARMADAERVRRWLEERAQQLAGSAT